MFNVIKGEMTYQTLKPVIVGKSKQNNPTDNAINNKELSKKSDSNEKKQAELDKLQDSINQKQEELNKLNKEIEMLKENSNKEIELLKEKAKQNIEKETELSKNKGYQEGYQNGVIKGEEEIVQNSKELFESINEIYHNIENYYKNLILNNEKNLINISLKISEKIIKKEIEEDKEIILYNLRESIKKISSTKSLTILVNYEDLDTVKNIKEKYMTEISGLEHIEIVQNANITKGTCKLDTALGTIDASLDGQLETIYENFMELVPDNDEFNNGDDLGEG